MAGSLTIDLFAPGMTHFHRAGLAGLYMTLQHSDPLEYRDIGSWELMPDKVVLHWKHTPKDFISKLIENSHGVENGITCFGLHKELGVDLAMRYELHQILMRTIYQHPRAKEYKKGDREEIEYEIEGKTVKRDYAPILFNRPQNVAQHTGSKHPQLFTRKGELVEVVHGILSYYYPGGAIRHGRSGVYSTSSSLHETPGNFLAILYAPLGVAYFKLARRRPDGDWDNKRKFALVIPHITDLEKFASMYEQVLLAPVSNLYASGLGDAAFLTLTALNIRREVMEPSGVDSCTVMSFGDLAWSSNQTPRTDVWDISIDRDDLQRFHAMWRTFANKVVVHDNGDAKRKKDSAPYTVYRCRFRGLVADNLSHNREWLEGFSDYLADPPAKGGKTPKNQAYEEIRIYREEVMNMVNDPLWWKDQRYRPFILSFQKGLQMHYAHLYEWCLRVGRNFNEKINAEADSIRFSLMRCRTPQAVRAIVVKYLGGKNPVAEKYRDEINSLMTNPKNWRIVRDMAVMAIASYSKKEKETQSTEENGKE